MKIMMVVGSYYPESFGGTEIFTKDLSEDLTSKGIKVCVICAGEKIITEFINGVKVYRIKMDRKPSTTIKNKVYNKRLDIYNKNYVGEYFSKKELKKEKIKKIKQINEERNQLKVKQIEDRKLLILNSGINFTKLG